MSESLGNIYRVHHQTRRESGFSILKDERGEILNTVIGTGKKILDIGCRDGALTKFFVKGNSVLGTDIDERALNLAKKSLGIETRILDLNGDWKDIGDRRFNAVVAGEVLEHLYNPDIVVKKVADYLEDGGIFIGSVPNAFSLKNRLRYLFGTKKYTPLSDPTHINQFHLEELKQILKKEFSHVEILGLGRYKWLASKWPNFFGFDLLFICRKN